jgi:uncharacterized Zn finger protein
MLNDEIECPYCGTMQEVKDLREKGHILLECDVENGGCGQTFFVGFRKDRIYRVYRMGGVIDV